MLRLRLHLMLGIISAVAACGRLEFPEVSVAFPSPSQTTAASSPNPTPAENHTPTATQTASLMATIPVSPTQPATHSIQAAERALRNGDWALSELTFTKVQSNSVNPDMSMAALVGLAKVHLRQATPNRAISSLEHLIKSYPDSHLLSDAHFLLGEAFMQLGQWKTAAKGYRDSIQTGQGIIDSYAWQQIAQTHIQRGEYLAAAQAFQSAILGDRAGNINFLLLDKAHALQMAGLLTEAMELLHLVNTNTVHDTTRAQMDYMRGEIAVHLGDYDKANEYFEHAFHNYPHSYYAYLSLIALLDAQVPVDDFKRGQTDYYAGQYIPAVQAFERYIANNANHDAAAHYQLALSYRKLDQLQNAILQFQEIIAGHQKDVLWPDAWRELAYTQWAWGNEYNQALETYMNFIESAAQDPSAPSALFDAARVAERQGNLDQAAYIWGQVADEYPESSRAAKSAFLSGISLYRTNNLPEALERFKQAQGMSPDDAVQQSAALLWLGKMHRILGAEDNAMGAWAKAIKSSPDGYYGLRASELMNRQEPFSPDTRHQMEFEIDLDRSRGESWLASKLGLANTDKLEDLSEELFSDPVWLRGLKLWNLGLTDDARTELDSLLRDKQEDALASYQLSLAYRQLGYYFGAIQAARNSLEAIGVTDLQEAPRSISHLRYGLYYQDLIIPAAQEYDIDPLMIFAIVRQESLFQSTVVSSAQAQGLMQVIPSTGEWIATQLAWPEYQNSDLYLPYINVKFGTYYLGKQVDTFGDNFYAALAAYNAGPGNAQIWDQLSEGDYDLFLEVIRLDEPRRYIQRVREHYAMYQHLYVD